MSKEAVVNAFLGCFMHVGLALVLAVYLPVALVCRLLHRLLVRPFARGEDLRGKVVLVTGASSGIGEVSQPGTLFFSSSCLLAPVSRAFSAGLICCTYVVHVS
jgi:hypothetical protein